MDRWPGAYPASEPPTPAPETPQQQQQQQPQYPVQQQSQRQPYGGLTEQPAQVPTHSPLATEVKPTDISAGHAHKDSGVGLANVEHYPLRGRTLDDERNPTVDEAIGGGTYVREPKSFPTQLEAQPKRNVQRDQGGQAEWPLSGAGVQYEQQPRKVQQQQQQQPARADLSHGHQPSDLPIAYQEQPHDLSQQPRAAEPQQQQHAAHGVVGLSHGHEPSDLPLAYQQNTVSQQPENLPQPTHTVQQQSGAVAASEDLSRNHAPSDLPLAYQESTRSQQSKDTHNQDNSRSRAEQGLAAGALAGAGVAAYEYSGKHDELPSQSRGSQYQQGTAGLDHGNQPSDLPTAYQEHARDTPYQPGQSGQQSTQGSDSPYWSAIHTAATGGIYNTVAGHGSARDDHNRHHNLPQRDTATEHTAADTTVPSTITSFPTGGVYNTVTGHGSGSEPVGPRDTGTSRGTYGEAGTQRAFPLATSDREGHPDDKSHSKTEQGLAAGALAGAGVAAYEYSDRRDESDRNASRDLAAGHGQAQAVSPPNADKKHKEDAAEKKDHHGVFGIFHRNKDDKQEKDPKQHRRSGSSGSSERRNTLKKSPPPKVAQTMRQSTPPKKDSLEQDAHRQADAGPPHRDDGSEQDHKAAVATGAGVAAGGVAAAELARRRADEQDAARQPDAAQTASHGSSQSDQYQTLASGTPSGVATGATGTSQQSASTHGPSHTTRDNYPSGTDTRPSGPYDTLADGTPSGIVAADNKQPTHNTATSQPAGTTRDTRSTENEAADTTGPYDTLESGTASGVAATGAASAAPGTTHHDAKDAAAPPTQSRSAEAGHAGDEPSRYNVLASGTPSGVNVDYSQKSKEMER